MTMDHHTLILKSMNPSSCISVNTEEINLHIQMGCYKNILPSLKPFAFVTLSLKLQVEILLKSKFEALPYKQLFIIEDLY